MGTAHLERGFHPPSGARLELIMPTGLAQRRCPGLPVGAPSAGRRLVLPRAAMASLTSHSPTSLDLRGALDMRTLREGGRAELVRRWWLGGWALDSEVGGLCAA